MHSLDENENIAEDSAKRQFVIDSCVDDSKILNQPHQVETRGTMFDESNTKCSVEIKNGMTSKKLNMNQTNELVLHNYSVSTVQ